jgi:Ca2+-binding EF-hand superfamily protein
MKWFSILAVIVLTLLFEPAIFAQDSQGQPPQRQRGGFRREKRMKTMDINNDGAISRDEWKGKNEAFVSIDKNGDGTLTREEMLAASPRQGNRNGRIKQMDTNDDQQISRDEWKGDPKRFARLDVNSDGVITKEELRAIRQNRPKRQGN